MTGNSQKKGTDRFSKIFFACSLFLLVFIAGIVFAVKILDRHIPSTHLVFKIKSALAKQIGEVFSRVQKKHSELLADDFFPGRQGITVSTRRVQPGYILMSRLSAEAGQFVVELMDKSTGKIIHTWAPRYEDIYKDPAVSFDTDDAQSVYNFILQHPLLLKDGSIVVFCLGGRLVRIDKNSQIVWQTKHYFHHSINLDHEGNIWAPAMIKPSRHQLHSLLSPLTENYENTKIPLFEESLVKLSPQGIILEEISLLDILLENGLKYTFVTSISDRLADDPTHLNDIEPLLEDTHFGLKGDLFLSMRNINLVLLYRPSTGRVIWHQIGPWIGQHDVTVNNPDEISILSNDRPMDPDNKIPRSRLFTYNFKKDAVFEPYAEAIDQAEFYVWSQGCQTVLPNGNVFLEATVRGRMIELSPDSVEWEYVNRYDEDHLGVFAWSRFIPAETVDLSLFDETQPDVSDGGK